jgi:hypothetical protein
MGAQRGVPVISRTTGRCASGRYIPWDEVEAQLGERTAEIERLLCA